MAPNPWGLGLGVLLAGQGAELGTVRSSAMEPKAQGVCNGQDPSVLGGGGWSPAGLGVCGNGCCAVLQFTARGRSGPHGACAR